MDCRFRCSGRRETLVNAVCIGCDQRCTNGTARTKKFQTRHCRKQDESLESSRGVTANLRANFQCCRRPGEPSENQWHLPGLFRKNEPNLAMIPLFWHSKTHENGKEDPSVRIGQFSGLLRQLVP